MYISQQHKSVNRLNTRTIDTPVKKANTSIQLFRFSISISVNSKCSKTQYSVMQNVQSVVLKNRLKLGSIFILVFLTALLKHQ